MDRIVLDGRPVVEEKRKKFRIYHRRSWHESDDKVLFKALKLQAILYDAMLIYTFVVSAYSLRRVETLPVREDVKALWQVLLAMIMLVAIALTRRPLIIVEEREVKK